MRTNKTKPFYNTTIPNDWKVNDLGSLGSFSKGKGITKKELSDEGLPCIRYGELYTTHDSVIREFISFIPRDVAKESKEINSGDILFAGSGETIEEIGKSAAYTKPEKAYAGGDVIILSTNENIDAECLSYSLETDLVRKQKRRLGQGNSVVHIYPSDLSKLRIPLPPLPEQKAIAHVLSLMETAINKSMQLIAQKELSKKWLMQNLLTSKKRLKGFSDKWDNEKLKNILNQAGNPLTPKENELYQQIGIRSHTKGIFHKEKVTGAALGNKRVFWIKPDCFVVNIVFAWEHAIAKTTDNEIGMIASHRFPMYRPKEDILDLDYLLYFFMSKRGKHLLGLASPGGAGRNKTLGKLEFMKLQIPVPTLKEQTAIAQVIQTADKEIQLLKTKTEKLREQKKGMMQVLLTGKKRLKIN